MTYKLFLDDERDPPNDNTYWVIARSSSEAISIIETNGIPSFISFDHDLDGDDTAMKLVWFLINSHMDGNLESFPTDYYVHSQNPVDVQNIKSLMSSYINTLEGV